MGSVLNAWLGPNAPWRVEPIFASIIKADDIARWIDEASLAPQPRLIVWLLYEVNPFAFQLRDLLIECCAFKVNNCFRRLGQRIYGVNGEGGIANLRLEASVVKGINEQLKAHVSIERHRCGDI